MVQTNQEKLMNMTISLRPEGFENNVDIGIFSMVRSGQLTEIVDRFT